MNNLTKNKQEHIENQLIPSSPTTLKILHNLQTNFTEIEKIGTDDFLNRIRSQLNTALLMVRIIGSKLTKHFDRESDIDLFILVKECNYQVMHEISSICAEVNLQYEINLSPIIYSLEEHNKNVYFKTMFVRELNKGIPLYGTV